MNIFLTVDSNTASAYGTCSVSERHYCNFGVNPEFVELLASTGFTVAGKDDDGECRVMEIPQHPFFIGTLFVPQARSTPAQPNPLITAFLNSAK